MISSPLLVLIPGPESELSRHLLGGKAVCLAELQQLNVDVPPFYVVTSEAFRCALRANGLLDAVRQVHLQLGSSSLSSAGDSVGPLRDAILAMQLPVEVEQGIRRAHANRFPAGQACAVRSSASHEDNIHHSFAGVYDTQLDVVGPEAVLDAVRHVWASSLSERVVAYHLRHGLRGDDVWMAVVVQQMVAARCSGVMFTCDPLRPECDDIVINTCQGAGQSLVDGEVSGDFYRIDRPTGELAGRPVLPHAAPPDGDRDKPARSLTDAELQRAASVGQLIEDYYHRPLDIEFCFDHEGRLCVLQARPVTSGPISGSDRGNHLIWDNSNIVESYSGVTLPMTFSFIRRAYAIVYHCFADVMGISPRRVKANHDAFENMLGIFNGRVYYNLKNWYRLVGLFPGYAYNRSFMEAMMGVKETFAAEPKSKPPGLLRRWFVELPGLVGLVGRSGWNFLRIRHLVARFERHFDRCYEPWSQIDFGKMPPHEIMASYRVMEDTMLSNWKAPIINDFFVMVCYGILRQLCRVWCDDESGSLQNGLLCADGRLESAEPAKRILRLAALAERTPELRAAILSRPLRELPAFVSSQPDFAEFSREFARFLDQYGLRCVDELKLESRSYRDEPHRVYHLIRNYLAMPNAAVAERTSASCHQPLLRDENERRALDAIAARSAWLPRRTIFRWVLRNTREGVRNRENMRLARTRIYGVLRSMLRAIGQQFEGAGILDAADDIFYLTLDEVWDYIKGTAVTADLRGLVQLRRAEYARYQTDPELAPDSRFETFGIACHGNSFQRLRGSPTHPPRATNSLQGIGCCPGVVTGRVQIVRDPAEEESFTGDILVAERTDPGWVTIYPAFAGVLVERGSVLSHSAIVAREFGIPTIVAVDGLTRRLKTGQRVRMDGLRGRIDVLADDDEAPAASCPQPLARRAVMP